MRKNFFLQNPDQLLIKKNFDLNRTLKIIDKEKNKYVFSKFSKKLIARAKTEILESNN